MKTLTGGAVPIMNQYDTCQLVHAEIVPCLLQITMANYIISLLCAYSLFLAAKHSLMVLFSLLLK